MSEPKVMCTESVIPLIVIEDLGHAIPLIKVLLPIITSSTSQFPPTV